MSNYYVYLWCKYLNGISFSTGGDNARAMHASTQLVTVSEKKFLSKLDSYMYRAKSITFPNSLFAKHALAFKITLSNGFRLAQTP